MLKKESVLILVLLAMSLLLLGCNQPFIAPTSIPTLIPATLPAVTATPVAAVPEGTEAAPEDGEPVSPEDAIAAGKEVYEATCAVCHSLGSEMIVGPGLAGLFDRDMLPNGSAMDEKSLKEWIVTGGGGMPGMPLTAEQLDVLIPFLREATQQ